ncbi:hypothetical protein [Lysobacter olei]
MAQTLAGARADAMMEPRPRRGFVVFKWLMYALLAGDVVLYALYGRLTELVDTAAWLILLMLFEWETGGWSLPPRWRPALHGVRAVAALAVLGACIGYATEGEWLDFANEMVWLGVVALLELEVRLPPDAMRLHRMRRVCAIVLYTALVGFLLAWAIEGATGPEPLHAWLDAWDALLWLLAFVVIELNVFGYARHRRGKHRLA